MGEEVLEWEVVDNTREEVETTSGKKEVVDA